MECDNKRAIEYCKTMLQYEIDEKIAQIDEADGIEPLIKTLLEQKNDLKKGIDVIERELKPPENTEPEVFQSVSNAERTLNDFFSYLDKLGEKFNDDSLEGHKRNWLKSFNDC